MNVQYLEKHRTGLTENKEECQIISVEISDAEKTKYSEAQILTISVMVIHKGHKTSQKYITRMLEYSVFKNKTSVIC